MELLCYLTGPRDRLKDLAILSRLLADEHIASYMPAFHHFENILVNRTDDEWREVTNCALRHCDIVFRLEGVSEISDDEVSFAHELNKPVFTCYRTLIKYLSEFGE